MAARAAFVLCALVLLVKCQMNMADSQDVRLNKKMVQPILIVHGGAGDIPDERVPDKIKGCKLAAKLGYNKLMETGNILDAVEAAVTSMEDDKAFNCGYGSVLNLDAEVEMEASMQRGSDLRAGCVTLLKDIRHPISLARRVLEATPHSMLGGDGARRFAIKQGFEIVPPSSLVTKEALDALEDFINNGGSEEGKIEIGHTKNEGGVGTVGAVVVDEDGNIAVATSTGGITGKYVGRIGDTPQIGSGTYADNNVGGVSTTGHGESILKVCLAHRIITGIESGLSPGDATKKAIEYMTTKLNNTAGAITLSKDGDVGIYFSSNRMAWSYVQAGKIHFGIERDEHYVEEFKP